MVKLKLNLLVLMFSGFAMLAVTGCGESGTTVIKPEMSAEEIQAESERAAAASENHAPS